MKTPTTSSNVDVINVPDDFELWIGERHKWLQTAASLLVQNKKMPNEQDIATLAALAVAEALGTGGHSFSTVVPGSLAQASLHPTLSIRGLSDVRGVNAIRNGASLNFGQSNLTVVYGPNGSGKTGFSRLLKQACGSRSRDDLHGNVFEESSPLSSGKVVVSIDVAADTSLDWSVQTGPIAALRHVHVFDSKAASMYVAAKNEATYEPSRMRFVSSLIKICDQVAEHLTGEKLKLIKSLPQLPIDIAATQSGKWIGTLKAGLAQASIDEACDYPKELDEERIVSEAALAQKDIVGRLQALIQERTALDLVKTSLTLLRDRLSDAELQALIVARLDAQAKRKAASLDAAKVFESAPLDGVGQESWMLLWEQARNFSETHAYPSAAFPRTDDKARCVLCQQELGLDAGERLGHFEQFVKGGLEASAKAAEKVLDTLIKKLPAIPQADDWSIQASVLKIDEEKAAESLAAFSLRRKAAEVALLFADIPAFDWGPHEQAIAAISEALLAEEKSLKELQQDGKRKVLEARVLELRAIQWLNQNKLAIAAEVTRLGTIAALDKAISLANTVALTKKNNELAKLELDAGYQVRFANELKLLGGARLPVKPESKLQGKGKITFGISLQGAKKIVPAEDILSEGETRIVALAAFLADIAGSGQPSPFVFDDPISSLDQDFEERVVGRLVDLAKSRQVIVFTHRLSLLTLIETAVKKLKEQADLEKAITPVKLHIETLRRMGKQAGITLQLSVRDAKPKTAVNRLRDEFIPQLRKLQEDGDVAAYEERVKGVCGDFRIIVERCVEDVLMNAVLHRFRREVQTKGRIGALAKIESTDCALIDDLMTRYSAFEHSQSEELPAMCPELDELDTDVTALSAWIEEFSKRAVN